MAKKFLWLTLFAAATLVGCGGEPDGVLDEAASTDEGLRGGKGRGGKRDAGETPPPEDGGSPLPQDAGAPPFVDAGLPSPSPDAGAPAPDGGSQPVDAGAPPPADAGSPTPAPDAGVPSRIELLEEQVLALVNQRRAAGATCGTTVYPPTHALVMNSSLRTAARLHSQDMADQNYFSHTSLDGRSPWDRIRAAGYTYATSLGENIAAGTSTADAVMNLWMGSSGHCANIMSPSYRSIGVGYGENSTSTYRFYWTQNFGGI